MAFLVALFLLVVLTVPFSSQEDCQRVHARIHNGGTTAVVPVTYNGIEPDTAGCDVNPQRTYFECGSGQGVLSDGDIEPTHSVDISDPDQVHSFFVWHRDNGSVGLFFAGDSSVSYVEVYTLSLPSAKIGPPESTSFITDFSQTVGTTITPQTCSFSPSTTNTLSRNTFTLPSKLDGFRITFNFNGDTDWLFISEIKLCEGNPPSSISCDLSPPTTPTPTPSSPPSPPPSPPPITLSSPPPTVTPDLSQPDSVSLTCSVASPPTDDYQYQWQWWRNGAQLSSDSRFSITLSANTQFSSLLISGLRYSDAGDYQCRVEYGQCPDGVDCSGTTPVSGNIRLNLPVFVEVGSSGLLVREGSEVVVLTCEVYGYPRGSSAPEWTSPGRDLQTGRFNTTLSNGCQLSDGSVSSTEKVVSRLTIYCASQTDSGNYTCSVGGHSDTFPLDIGESKQQSSNCESLTGGVVVLAVLLLISLTINLLSVAHYIYRLRVRGGKSGGGGGGGGGGSGNQEQLYEQVDDGHPLRSPGDAVTLKQNEAYGQISCQSRTPVPTTAL